MGRRTVGRRGLLQLGREGLIGLLPGKIYRGNNAVFVSVDLIGEKNRHIRISNIVLPERGISVIY